MKHTYSPLSPDLITSTPLYLDLFKLAFRPFTEKKLQLVLESYMDTQDSHILGYFEDGKLIAILGYTHFPDHIHINQLAVQTNLQGMGVGSKVISYLHSKYPGSPLQTKTDKQAVGFYQKLEFKCTAVQENSDSRYLCMREKSTK